MTIVTILMGVNAELNYSEDVTMRFKCPSCRASLKPHDLVNDKKKRAAVAEHLKKYAGSKRKAEEELDNGGKIQKK